jgi:DNA-binding NtrC family response regulator
MSRPSAEPRLVAVRGPLTGEVFRLAGGEVTLGRDATSTICVADPALSRRHCTFARNGATWLVRDDRSSNGTFVNSAQITSHDLLEGDRIDVGESTLLFVASASGAASGDFVDEEPIAPTTRLRMDETVYLERAPAAAERSRVEHGLRALLTISTVVNSAATEAELHDQLLALMRELFEVQAAAVVALRDDHDMAIVRSAADPSWDLRIVRGLVERAIADRTGVLNAAASPSVLCAALGPQSALYLVGSPQKGRFDEDHLQLVTAVARISAIALENVRRVAALERETERLQADLQLTHNMVGDSEPMRRVYERIARVARADTTALIVGETGTGKELAARAIHLNSPRARRPFIAINCAALTETLLETELFGHERGAFTGAVAQKRGKFELADGGTLFLDEVGEMPPPLQTKLLRVLQEREFERVGGTRPIRVDVRLISATNRSLPAEIKDGRFRQDLYFRLNVVSIEMPPLRERRSDIAALARHFVHRYVGKAGRRVTGISPRAMACLTGYDWPGNVRELENAIERALVLGSNDEILVDDLPETIVETAPVPVQAAEGGGYHAAVIDAKKQMILKAFRATSGSYTDTARMLGIHPNYLHRLIRNLGLKQTLEADA